MNDLSLGRLRIANPDESSPETSAQPQSSLPAFSAVSPLHTPDGVEEHYTGSSTQLEQEPVLPNVETHGTHQNGHNITPAAYYQQQRPVKRDHRQNLALNYQDQQQAQFPQDPRTVGRPSSMYYTQLPVNPGVNGLTRTDSRHRRDVETPVPQRTGSGTPTPDHLAGYRPDALLLHRRSSRHMTAEGRSRQAHRNPSPTNSAPSGSPYRAEGGPMSSSEEWKERGAAVGVRRETDANGRPVLKSVKKGVKDFTFGQTLGEGSYSTVLAAKDRQSNVEYAIKILDKRHIIKEDKVKYVNIEKEALNRLAEHPGVIKLYYTFQDERSLYFVLDLCSGGELLSTLKQLGTFDEECTRFYAAQILDTIAHMHHRGVIHRDLKPENVLLDDKKFVKITDFGTAKMLKAHVEPATGRTYYDSDTSPYSDRANSFVGTAEYVSPELLNDKNACKASDLWAFGCMVFQLLAGRPPFKAANEYLTFQKVQSLQYEFPLGFPDVARDLVERLLVLDPQHRLTIDGIKNHEFFQGVKWGRALWTQKAPTLKPYVPPPRPPIRLNGTSSENVLSTLNAVGGDHSASSTIMPPASAARVSRPRAVTELAPPSQLDIAWSSVLTDPNERILKLGNLNVGMAQGPYTPGGEGGNKIARFFGANNARKRPRLVMVTSSARVILAAAGGEEKKCKDQVNLIAPGTEITTTTDSKGMTSWIISTVSFGMYPTVNASGSLMWRTEGPTFDV